MKKKVRTEGLKCKFMCLMNTENGKGMPIIVNIKFYLCSFNNILYNNFKSSLAKSTCH
jgi:hypothetical protein